MTVTEFTEYHKMIFEKGFIPWPTAALRLANLGVQVMAFFGKLDDEAG